MSSLDFCVCGGSKNQNQELCGECRMAEIEAVILKHTWVSNDDDNCDEYDPREEYLIDQENKNKVPTRECIYCQEEKAFDLLCDDCVGLYNTHFYWAIKHKDIIDSLVLSHFEENDLGREEAFRYLLYIEEKSLKEVVEGLRTPCDCGKNYEDGCECLPF